MGGGWAAACDGAGATRCSSPSCVIRCRRWDNLGEGELGVGCQYTATSRSIQERHNMVDCPAARKARRVARFMSGGARPLQLQCTVAHECTKFAAVRAHVFFLDRARDAQVMQWGSMKHARRCRFEHVCQKTKMWYRVKETPARKKLFVATSTRPFSCTSKKTCSGRRFTF